MKRAERAPRPREEAERRPAPMVRPMPRPASALQPEAGGLRNARQEAGKTAVAETARAGAEADRDGEILPSPAALYERARLALEQRPEAHEPGRPGPAAAYDSIIAMANRPAAKAASAIPPASTAERAGARTQPTSAEARRDGQAPANRDTQAKISKQREEEQEQAATPLAEAGVAPVRAERPTPPGDDEGRRARAEAKKQETAGLEATAEVAGHAAEEAAPRQPGQPVGQAPAAAPEQAPAAAPGQAPAAAPGQAPVAAPAQAAGGGGMGGMGGMGGAGGAAGAAAAVTMTATNPGDVLVSLRDAPASAALDALSQAQSLSPGVLSRQREAAQEALPEIETPTGLPAAGAPAAAARPSAAAQGAAAATPAELPAPAAGGPAASGAEALVPEAPAAPAPAPTRLAGGDSAEEGQNDAALAHSAQQALASVAAPVDAVPTRAGEAPRVDLGGEADPAQIQSNLQASQQQTAAAHAQEVAATRQDFGEDDIFPAPDDEILAARTQLSVHAPASVATPGGSALPAEALASIDAQATPILQQRIGQEQARYAQGEQQYEADSQAAHQQARDDIATLEDDTRAQQEQARTDAQGEVTSARQDWQQEIDGVQTELETKAGKAKGEHLQKIQTEEQRGNREATRHIAEAEQKAEVEKRKAEGEVAREKESASKQSSGFWGWVKSKAKALVDGLKKAVNFIYDNLRKAVKALFELAKRLALAAIELARTAIVGLIKAYGAILKGLVSIALAAFPEIRARVLARIDQAVNAATELVNKAADLLKKGVSAILDFLASTIDKVLGLIQDLYNAAFTIIGMIISGELKELFERLGRLIDAAKAAPGQFETAAYEELLGGNLDEPLQPAELMAAGRMPPAPVASPDAGAPEVPGAVPGTAEGEEPLPGPPWTDDKVGVDAVASGEELSPELSAELMQLTGGAGEVTFGESADESRSLDSIVGTEGQEQTATKSAPGQTAAGPQTGYTDGLTPRERAAVKWEAMKKSLAEWWSKNWPYVLAGGVLAVAGFIVANILTGGAILAALPAIMTVVGYLFTGLMIVQLAGHVRDFLQKGWDGDIQGGGKSLAKALAAGAIELISWLTFKVGSVALKGAKAAAKGAVKGAQAVAKGAAKGAQAVARGTSALARGAVRIAGRGAQFVIQGGKVLLRGVKQGISRGVKRLRELGARLLQRTRFKGFRIRIRGRRFTLEGKINPWVVLMEGEMKGRLVEVGDEALQGLKAGDEGLLNIAGKQVSGRVVSHAGPEALTILKAADVDDAIRHVLQNVKGLTDEQARFLLEQVRAKGGAVVFGGSRVRGAPKVDDLGRVLSDLDVGFEGLTQNQITKIVNKFNKTFTGSSQGSGRIIEHTWIHPGSQPRSIPEILTPEEFFARFGIRADGRNIGKAFGPSGHVKVSSDGTIEIFKP